MTCGKCGLVLKPEMRYCPLCGTSVDGISRKGEKEKPIYDIRQLQKEKNYTEIAKHALAGNIFAEYTYIQYAIQKMKTWTQDAEGTSNIRQAMEQNNPAAMAIWGIMLYVANRTKGTFEMLFEGPGSDSAAYERGIALIQKAANLGDAAALSYMGAWCASGDIKQVLKNERDAYRYTQAAANKDYPTALYRLGTWHLKGVNGVRKVPEIGYELIEKAAFWGESSAVDFVKKYNDKWFETDLRASEDQKQIGQCVKLLRPIKKAITNDIIFDEIVDLTYDGIAFSSENEIAVYKAECDFVSNIFSSCDSLNCYLRAFDILKSTKFIVYDAGTDIRKVRKQICKLTGTSDETLDEFLKVSSQCGYIKNDEIILNEIPAFLINRLLPKLDAAKGYFLHSNGIALSDNQKLFGMRQSLQIPPDEPVYVVRPTGMPWNFYTEKSKGYAITETGFYCKAEHKRAGFIKWRDFGKSDIYIGDFSGDQIDNIENGDFWINDYCLMLPQGKAAQLQFFKDLKSIVQLVHEVPQIPKIIYPPTIHNATHEQATTASCTPNCKIDKHDSDLTTQAEVLKLLSVLKQIHPKICPVCSKGNKPTAKFCTSCGSSLDPIRFCSQCGAKLRPGKKFCSGCGAKIV